MNVTLMALGIVARRVAWAVVKAICCLPVYPWWVVRAIMETDDPSWHIPALLIPAVASIVGVVIGLIDHIAKDNAIPVWVPIASGIVLAQMLGAYLYDGAVSRWQSVVEEAEEHVRLKAEGAEPKDVLLRASEQSAAERLLRVVGGHK